MKKRTRRKPKTRRRNRSVSGNQSLAPSVISGVRRRRKKHTKFGTVRKHKRRVSGISMKSPIIQAMLGLGTGLGASYLIDKYVPMPATVSGKIKAAALVAIGAGTAVMGKKNPFMLGVGVGTSLYGGIKGAKEFGLIAGMDEFMSGIGLGQEDTMLIEMNGIDDESSYQLSPPVVSGQPSLISGNPSIISGY